MHSEMEYDKEKSCYMPPRTNKRCVHSRVKSDCKECDPTKYCFEHNMPLRMCGKCARHPSICKHHRRKTRCVECAVENNGKTGSVCIHKRRKYQCTECAKLGLNTEKQRSEVCPCGMRKRYCGLHGGANLCVVCCETTVLRVGTACSKCHVDPSKPVRIKKREVEVIEWIKTLPPYTSYNKSIASMLRKEITDVQDEARKAAWFDVVRTTKTYYPDFMWTLPDRHVILEIDEHQHQQKFHGASSSTQNSYSNDSNREVDMINLISKISDKRIVLVRYNPDAFQTGFKPRRKYLSMLTSREARKKILVQALASALTDCSVEMSPLSAKRILYVRLFFDCTCMTIEGCNFSHVQGFDSVDEFQSVTQGGGVLKPDEVLQKDTNYTHMQL
jgi:hypothetical protein